jgi:hypothetical protein
MKSKQLFHYNKMSEIIQICQSCGSSLDNHNYRHIAKPINISKTFDDKGPIFNIEAVYFKETIKTSECKFPQCRGAKMLHGTIFRHDFIGSEYKVRNIKIQLPGETKCRYCNILLKDHKRYRHGFCYKININGKTEHDIISITDDENNKLKDTEKMYYGENFSKIEGKMLEQM